MLEPRVLAALPRQAHQMLPLGLADLVEVAEVPDVAHVDPAGASLQPGDLRRRDHQCLCDVFRRLAPGHPELAQSGTKLSTAKRGTGLARHDAAAPLLMVSAFGTCQPDMPSELPRIRY